MASFQSATIFSVASMAAGWSDSDWNFSVTGPPSAPSSLPPPLEQEATSRVVIVRHAAMDAPRVFMVLPFGVGVGSGGLGVFEEAQRVSP